MVKSDWFTRWTWITTIFAVVACLSFSFFFWELLPIVTPFLADYAWIGLLPIVLLAFTRAVTLPMRYASTRGKWTLVPLILLSVTVAFVSLVDLSDAWIEANYWCMRGKRMEAVALIERGEGADIAELDRFLFLPRGVFSISLGGDVDIYTYDDNLKVLFFTYRGILGNNAGFMYIADDSVVKEQGLGRDIEVVKKMEDHWYYIVSH